MCDIETRTNELSHKHMEVDEANQLNKYNRENAIARNNDLAQQIQDVTEE